MCTPNDFSLTFFGPKKKKKFKNQFHIIYFLVVNSISKQCSRKRTVPPEKKILRKKLRVTVSNEREATIGRCFVLRLTKLTSKFISYSCDLRVYAYEPFADQRKNYRRLHLFDMLRFDAVLCIIELSRARVVAKLF